MKKAIMSITLACLCCFSACGTLSSETQPTHSILQNANQYVDDSTATAYFNDGSAFTPVLRFVVVGDTHFMDGYLAQSNKRMENLFNDMYAYSHTQEYDKLDAVVVVGDYVDDGAGMEYPNFSATWQKNIKSETAFLCLQAGHELINGHADDHILYTGNDMGTHATINGYHFITISNSRYLYDKDGNIIKYEDGSNLVVSTPDPACDTTWINDALVKAESDTGTEKPIFVFHHHPIADTIIGTASEASPIFAPLLDKYANVVDFSAHTHIVNNHPRAIMQKNYTTYSAGALFYSSALSDYPDKNKNSAYDIGVARATISGATVVEVDKDGRIRMLPYNLSARRFANDINTKTEQKQLIYYIETAGNKASWLYTEQRFDTADLPMWKENASIELKIEDFYVNVSPQLPCKRLVLTLDTAIDADGIEGYKLEVIRNSDNKRIKFYHSTSNSSLKDYGFVDSQYGRAPFPSRITAETTGLATSDFVVGYDYTLKVWAIDAFHKQSETPLTKQFTL